MCIGCLHAVLTVRLRTQPLQWLCVIVLALVGDRGADRGALLENAFAKLVCEPPKPIRTPKTPKK
eukprot:4015799-Amphidinium_carterae.1